MKETPQNDSHIACHQALLAHATVLQDPHTMAVSTGRQTTGQLAGTTAPSTPLQQC